MFDVNVYNQLPSIAQASVAFNSKLASSGLTLDALLEKLRPLFCSDEYKGQYGVWLLRHHFNLEEGERMVKKGLISEPAKEQSSNIVVERWGGRGEELEHLHVDNSNDLRSPPSAEFIRQFQEIVGAYNIDCLGICYAPSEDELKIINAGYMFLETCEEGRKHLLTVVPVDDPSLNHESIFRTTWSMVNEGGFGCCHSCCI